MAKPVVHFEIAVKDEVKAAEFYRTMFEWEIDPFPEMKAFGIKSAGEKAIGGDISRNDSTFPSHCAIYVQVEDIPAYLAKAESLGGKPIFGPMDLGSGYGFIGMFQDPEGILIGLYQKVATV